MYNFQVSSIFKEVGITSMTVQVEKEVYFHHLSGLSANFDQIVDFAQNFKVLHFNDSRHAVTSI